ncbi:MAG: aryl-sulfate sulfotransferase [Alphaproteobacteria bacterium]|nr:MAG: aryl-sulfate sulfotransferase [Alphaproteobacteria bacterium]
MSNASITAETLGLARPAKRSLRLAGHRTSVSVEEPFWNEFRAIARRRGRSLNALAAEIDRVRGLDTGLATAIRLFVLADLRARLAACEAELAARA